VWRVRYWATEYPTAYAGARKAASDLGDDYLLVHKLHTGVAAYDAWCAQGLPRPRLNHTAPLSDTSAAASGGACQAPGAALDAPRCAGRQGVVDAEGGAAAAASCAGDVQGGKTSAGLKGQGRGRGRGRLSHLARRAACPRVVPRAAAAAADARTGPDGEGRAGGGLHGDEAAAEGMPLNGGPGAQGAGAQDADDAARRGGPAAASSMRGQFWRNWEAQAARGAHVKARLLSSLGLVAPMPPLPRARRLEPALLHDARSAHPCGGGGGSAPRAACARRHGQDAGAAAAAGAQAAATPLPAAPASEPARPPAAPTSAATCHDHTLDGGGRRQGEPRAGQAEASCCLPGRADPMLGARVAVYWPQPYSQWFAGLVNAHDEHSGKYRVEYDDGDVKYECLRSLGQHGRLRVESAPPTAGVAGAAAAGVDAAGTAPAGDSAATVPSNEHDAPPLPPPAVSRPSGAPGSANSTQDAAADVPPLVSPPDEAAVLDKTTGDTSGCLHGAGQVDDFTKSDRGHPSLIGLTVLEPSPEPQAEKTGVSHALRQSVALPTESRGADSWAPCLRGAIPSPAPSLASSTLASSPPLPSFLPDKLMRRAACAAHGLWRDGESACAADRRKDDMPQDWSDEKSIRCRQIRADMPACIDSASFHTRAVLTWCDDVWGCAGL
jgi:hypothetical protein